MPRSRWAASIKAGAPGSAAIRASHPERGDYVLYCDGSPELLFTENETNTQHFWGQPNATPWVKDAFHRYVVSGEIMAVNPAKPGTKAAARYVLDMLGRGSCGVRLGLCAAAPAGGAFSAAFEATLGARLADADAFYERITAPALGKDERHIYRQALAGMLRGKQYYLLDVDTWLKEHVAHPLLGGANKARNKEGFHLFNADIISMPDKWEYPWYAAWDLAFHTVSLALVDFDFAKQQLLLMLRSLYNHPNRQIPAYELNLSDVNPPVHAALDLAHAAGH